MPIYRRALLKLSGESLMGSEKMGVHLETIQRIAAEVVEVHKAGVELALVIGGGNIFRGIAAGTKGMERATGDYMGMLATVMNCLAFADALKNQGLKARVMSAINILQVAEPYIRPKAMHYLDKQELVIFAAGTGNPFFTTDTAAALRASEIGAEVVLKATNVDGIYTADPKKNAEAKRYQHISFDEVIRNRLSVMDATAFALCRDQNLPIRVFSIKEKGALLRVVQEKECGTLVDNSCEQAQFAAE